MTCLHFFPAASEIYFFDGESTKIRLLEWSVEEPEVELLNAQWHSRCVAQQRQRQRLAGGGQQAAASDFDVVRNSFESCL